MGHGGFSPSHICWARPDAHTAWGEPLLSPTSASLAWAAPGLSPKSHPKRVLPLLVGASLLWEQRSSKCWSSAPLSRAGQPFPLSLCIPFPSSPLDLFPLQPFCALCMGSQHFGIQGSVSLSSALHLPQGNLLVADVPRDRDKGGDNLWFSPWPGGFLAPFSPPGPAWKNSAC